MIEIIVLNISRSSEQNFVANTPADYCFLSQGLLVMASLISNTADCGKDLNLPFGFTKSKR